MKWSTLILASMTLWLASVTLTRAGTVTYIYTDPQGTPLAEADAQGNVTARFDYRPYGAQALGTPPAGPGYTGHVNDPDTGLVYMQARYYDPGTGRFLSVDPVGPAPGNTFSFNRYGYASNNPIVNIDPDGRQAQAATQFGRELRALWISKGDDKKYNAIMENYKEQDRENLKVLVGLTDAGIVVDAVQVVAKTVKGGDASAQGKGAVTGEITGAVAKKILAKKIGDPAAEAVAAIVGEIAGGIAETAAEPSKNTNSSQNEKPVERKANSSNQPSNPAPKDVQDLPRPPPPPPQL